MRVRNDAWLPLGNRNGACLPRPGLTPSGGCQTGGMRARVAAWVVCS
jgi:hypothetical protein